MFERLYTSLNIFFFSLPIIISIQFYCFKFGEKLFLLREYLRVFAILATGESDAIQMELFRCVFSQFIYFYTELELCFCMSATVPITYSEILILQVNKTPRIKPNPFEYITND